MPSIDSAESASAALVLVDVQNDFVDPGLAELGTGYTDRVATLLAHVRAAGVPVVHVHSVFAPDGSDWMRRYRPRGRIPCVTGTDGVEVRPEATPLAGEPVVVKQTFDAFIRTGLDTLLRDLQVEAVLVAGLVTSTCVLFTATSAMQRGYTVGVVEDATADQPSVHARVLKRYPFIFDVVTIDGALDWTRAALARSDELGPMPAR